MTYLEKTIGGMAGQLISNMHTAVPARVVSYDENAHTAVLQPLFKNFDGQDYPVIHDVPVSRWRYRIMQNKNITESGQSHSHPNSGSGPEAAHKHPIEFEEIIEDIKMLLYKGDIVCCIIFEKSIDSISSKEVHLPLSKRTFDLSDGFVSHIIYTAG